jgi:hypothetical protein
MWFVLIWAVLATFAAISATIIARRLILKINEVLDYHERFIERVNKTLYKTNKFLEIPMFEFSPEVVEWVEVVREFRNTLNEVIKDVEYEEPDEPTDQAG